MPLIYSLISREVQVLAEFTAPGLSGNFSAVSRVLIKKAIQSGDSRASYVYDHYVFHYIVADRFIYLTLSDQEFPRSVAFAYLAEIQSRFQFTYGERAKTAIAFAFNADFSKVLQLQMEKFNDQANGKGGNDKIAQINKQIGEVKDNMLRNIDQVLERGERIELLVDKTEVLEQHAFKFQRGAKTLKRQMCIKNAKWTIIAIVVFTLVLYIILAIACGGADLPKCK
jgi:vesicle-associated membrane protein 7